jgi:valyl-tRNA synthetase
MQDEGTNMTEERAQGEKTGEVPKIPEEFLAPYDPTRFEDGIYKLWEDSGYFNPDVCVKDGVTAPDAEPFSIVLPPPNVTGILHMGSALMLVIEDILVRYHRMRGYRTLWLPGTDSAAIATQSKVESEIYKTEKKTRYDLGREELLRRIDAFTEVSKATIINQVKKMGSSLDWSRYAYTMDEKRYHAVMEAFVRMYNAGLIYRGDRIVNWDPKGQTTISDDEIVYKEEAAKFYYFQYGPFVIGTARPETKFGDKYVVMHPDDERYKEYRHGQKIDLEWINGPITATVIKDTAGDPEMGTGAMTITPWHSVVDFEIAERHGLDKEQIIDQYGKLLPIAGQFAGMHISKAREQIVEKLQRKGLVVKMEENYIHNLATAERTGEVIEPQIMKQWFIAVNKSVLFPDGKTQTLKERMRESVASGAITILPERFQTTYYRWIDNLRDWCISRQIWFGHRIPAWFKDGEITVQIESPGDGWQQDPDTLDTWFSSGLWTFSTLGWPDATDDLQTYHPTTVIETGYDIIFFWVARMILMSGFLLGDIPFRHVYLHGIVRDGQGRKISKSLGNNIDPLDMGEKYGMDAVRMSLVTGMAPGTDSKISEEKIRGYKHFANKFWNISRFVLQNTSGLDMNATYTDADEARERAFQTLTDEITGEIDNFQIHLAIEKLYHYLWDILAAEMLEESKKIFRAGTTENVVSRKRLLSSILVDSLKLLHPFMPFVTEAIWQLLPAEMKSEENKGTDMLMVAKWPTPSANTASI